MKHLKKLLLVLIVTLSFSSLFAQETGITGDWFNDSKEGKVEIYEAKDGKYYGKLIWIKEPLENGKPKLDKKNKDESLRSKPLIGLLLLKGFTKDGDIYTGGTIYDPQSGKTYACKITPKDANTLSIRGYIGVSLIGRTTVWTRTTK